MPLDHISRERFAHLPTPLEPMENLSKALGGPQLFVKRDDCTGLAFGGNKTRKLEFLMAEAKSQGADTLITQGAVQSNHARQVAAIATKYGMRCELLFENRVEDATKEYLTSGNVLLDQMFGAAWRHYAAGTDMNEAMAVIAEEVRHKGGKPYIIPGGGSNPLGALGYVQCALELEQQTEDLEAGFDWLVHGTGSSGTQAGLVAGMHVSKKPIPVLGISVRAPKDKQEATVRGLAERTIETFKLAKELRADSVIADADYVGPGYGIPDERTWEAIDLAARHEGLLLDPVYTGKGMAGLIGLVRKGFFKRTDRIVFLHTGGNPALFAYQQNHRP